ncbi:MAG: DUF3592 domain-containing protein [Planctomycetota bacterium]|nr:DUF3592 domain-containing protein [Planctomycetota bacterium]
MNSDNLFTLLKRLMTVGGSLACLIFFSAGSNSIWRIGVKVESWDIVTADVVGRRMETTTRYHGETDHHAEIDVRYGFNGGVYRTTFVSPNQLLTGSTVDIYVNPENPNQSSLGFERGLFLTYALAAIISLIAVVLLGILAFFPHLASKDHKYENGW